MDCIPLKLRIVFIILLIGAGWIPYTTALSKTPPSDQEELDYHQAKKTFYTTLAQSSLGFPFMPEDYQQLQQGHRKLPGLYEHLMNFFPLLYSREDGVAGTSQRSYEDHAKEMARELLRSIPVDSPKKDISPLKSILLSTGYYAQKALPDLHRFSRTIHHKVRAQWAIHELQVKKAHTVTRGHGIRLAVIDTGLDPSLRAIRSRVIAYKDLLDSAPPYKEQGRFPYDQDGHGTSLTSLILQVAPEVELMIIKFYESESMGRVPTSRWTHFLIASGMMWAAHRGADIINISACLQTDSPALRQAVKYCWEKNIVVITSMGNSRFGGSPTPLTYPACYPWTIAVGGIESTGDRLKVWDNSAAGDYVDIVAPAKDIWVESPQYQGRPRAVYNRFGNSLAASFTSGSAALLLSVMTSRSLNHLRSRPGRLPEVIRRILQDTASNQKLGYSTPNPFSGHGLIEILPALAMAKSWTLNHLTSSGTHPIF